MQHLRTKPTTRIGDIKLRHPLTQDLSPDTQVGPLFNSLKSPCLFSWWSNSHGWISRRMETYRIVTLHSNRKRINRRLHCHPFEKNPFVAYDEWGAYLSLSFIPLGRSWAYMLMAFTNCFHLLNQRHVYVLRCRGSLV